MRTCFLSRCGSCRCLLCLVFFLLQLPMHRTQRREAAAPLAARREALAFRMQQADAAEHKRRDLLWLEMSGFFRKWMVQSQSRICCGCSWIGPRAPRWLAQVGSILFTGSAEARAARACMAGAGDLDTPSASAFGHNALRVK